MNLMFHLFLKYPQNQKYLKSQMNLTFPNYHLFPQFLKSHLNQKYLKFLMNHHHLHQALPLLNLPVVMRMLLQYYISQLLQSFQV